MNCPRCQTANPDGAKFCLNCGSALEAQRSVEGERKFVTVLFADVVGSTAMGERLDPEQVIEIMNGAFAFLNAAVAKYGGTVARLMGDAILALFGAPVAHEDDAERAVRAGLEIQAAAKEYGRMIKQNYALDFNVRVGINSGLVVLAVVGDQIRTEYTAMGDTTNVAARMQSAAAPGSVLISADTYRLIKNLFHFKLRGAIEVKGKSAPIETYEVLAPKLAPGKARGLEGLSSPLVGRDAEYQLLREKVDAVRAGRGAFVTLIGEAGLGKSRLIAETRKLVETDSQPPVAWLETRALAYGQTTTYYPWQQLLREAIGAREGDARATVRDKLQASADKLSIAASDMPFLEALLAVESDASLQTVIRLEGDELPQRITAAMCSYLVAQARQMPTVLVFDDLHWADRASLALLLSVAKLIAEHRLLLIGLLRPDKTAASWSFMERARGALGGSFSEIILEPLSTETAQELLGNLLYIEDLPQSVHELILKKSEGNPFFLEEVIRTLIDAGHIVQENNHWRATREIVNVTIPDTLAGVLSARLDRLLEETKRVAQTAAVIGRIFTYRVLDKVCTEAPPQEQTVPVEPHLQTLTYEELIRERTREPEIEYIFKHTLTQEAAYELLLIKRRKELHRRVGSVLEELYAERLDELAPTLAHHFWHGEEWARAAEYAMRAGARAMNVYALREALEHYQRAYEALEKLPNAPREALVDAILGWTPAALKYRAHAEVLNRLEHAEQTARDLNDKRRLALTLHWIAHLHLNDGFASRAIEPLLENYQLASELGDERLSVYPSWFMAFSLVANDPRSALAQLEHVIELAGKHNHKGIQAHALATKAMAHARIGEFAQANAEIQRALAVVRGIDAPVMQADVDLLSSLACFDMGDRQRGLEYSWRGTEKSLATNAMECVAAGYYIMGVANLETRSVAESLAAFEESMKFLPELADDKALANQIRAGVAIAQFLSGRIAAIKDIESALANAQALGDLYTAAFISKALGESYMQLDEFERAEQYLSSALDYYRRNDMRPYLARTLQSLADLYDRQECNTDAEDARAEAQALMEALQAPPAGEGSFALDVDELPPARPASG